MNKKVFIGIQDGTKDGFFESGLTLHKLTPELVFQSPGYRPYWVAEVSEEIWASWLTFIGPPTVNYTGLNETAWERFWGTYTDGGILKQDAWNKWQAEHLKALAT
jgi:hypothetical protein